MGKILVITLVLFFILLGLAPFIGWVIDFGIKKFFIYFGIFFLSAAILSFLIFNFPLTMIIIGIFSPFIAIGVSKLFRKKN